VAGLAALLAPGGLLTVEVPHIVRLVEENQFDTIYHEHFSYFSVLTAQRIFAAHGLLLTDVDELATHGGSVRLHVRHADAGVPPAPDVEAVIEAERRAGVEDPGWYRAFGQRAEETKHALVEFLIGARRQGRTVAGYGAPGKSATLLNFCGVRTDLLEYTVDRNPYKQGRFLPGTHIPIHHPDRIRETRPDYLLVLPWNLREEILEQMSYIREWSGRFVLPIPRLEVI
jgi:hypothetical protein